MNAKISCLFVERWKRCAGKNWHKHALTASQELVNVTGLGGLKMCYIIYSDSPFGEALPMYNVC